MDQLKIFVSSTQTDLQPERDAVQAIIESFGYQCLRAETLDAPGKSPEEACKMMAQNCDIYIGVFGPRYGYIPPHLGISVTEMEYQTAQLHNPKKIFIYVKDVMDTDIEAEQRTFLQRVQDFAEGYFRHEKFLSPNQLADQVKRDIITWTTAQIRNALNKETEISALRDKLAYMSRVMERYGVPEELR